MAELKAFIVDEGEKRQRYLEESRSEKEKSSLSIYSQQTGYSQGCL